MCTPTSTPRQSGSLSNTSLMVVAGLLSLAQSTHCQAGIGLAEWTLKTPGMNLIADADPFSDTHGVCLRQPADPKKGLDKDTVLVSHIQWWMYYQDFVVGKAKKGYFVVDERTKDVQYSKDSASLDQKIAQLKLGKPLSKRLVPQDGWNMVVLPQLKQMYQKQLQDLEAGRGTAKDLSAAERDSMKTLLQDMLKKLERSAKPSHSPR